MPAENSTSSYYAVLGVTPSASVQDIRRAYRELSKLYHPDTTTLPPAIATEKFQQLNEAYATLSSPDLRASYDIRSGYSRVRVMRPDLPLDAPPTSRSRPRSSAYLDPTDRPLSPGEMFALFILGVTFALCLLVVVMVGATRGEIALQSFQRGSVPAVVQFDSTAATAASGDPSPAPTASEMTAAPPHSIRESLPVAPPPGDRPLPPHLRIFLEI